MKKLLFITFCLLGFLLSAKSQTIETSNDTIKLLLENDKMIVTEYVSNPGKDMCGIGKHSHNPHLTILLTDATVLLTTEDGKSQNIEAKAGATFWSDYETHSVINTGGKVVKAFLIEPK
ncbi:MAG: hypothetical protein EHM47_12350 [Ignavibacteriales bacterium]|nr:MAG: hypothetical protein EHM47_12350 [Ignavibacteriales bacterium]